MTTDKVMIISGNNPKTHQPESNATFPEGQALNLPSYDILPHRDPTRRYLILSSPRTGSNYLCRRLCNVTGRFGLPSEYLHPKAIHALSVRLLGAAPGSKVQLGNYMTALGRVRTTADGWFGVKVQPKQLLAAVDNRHDEAMRFMAGFDRLVLMTRRDKLGQAVSGAIAQVTGTWFNDGEEPKLADARIATLFPLITNNLAQYVAEERFILNIGRTIVKPLLRIEYEEIQEDAQGAFLNLADFLAGDGPAALAEVQAAVIPEKPKGVFARKVRKYYLEFIAGKRSSVYLSKSP